jgi:hypothetical protein
MAINNTIYIPTGTYNVSPITIPSGYTWNGVNVVPIPTIIAQPVPGIAPNQLPIVYLDYYDPPKEKVKPSPDGCTCKRCGEFYPYAIEPEDGKGLVCYSCRIVW